MPTEATDREYVELTRTLLFSGKDDEEEEEGDGEKVESAAATPTKAVRMTTVASIVGALTAASERRRLIAALTPLSTLIRLTREAEEEADAHPPQPQPEQTTAAAPSAAPASKTPHDAPRRLQPSSKSKRSSLSTHPSNRRLATELRADLGLSEKEIRQRMGSKRSSMVRSAFETANDLNSALAAAGHVMGSLHRRASSAIDGLFGVGGDDDEEEEEGEEEDDDEPTSMIRLLLTRGLVVRLTILNASISLLRGPPPPTSTAGGSPHAAAACTSWKEIGRLCIGGLTLCASTGAVASPSGGDGSDGDGDLSRQHALSVRLRSITLFDAADTTNVLPRLITCTPQLGATPSTAQQLSSFTSAHLSDDDSHGHGDGSSASGWSVGAFVQNIFTPSKTSSSTPPPPRPLLSGYPQEKVTREDAAAAEAEMRFGTLYSVPPPHVIRLDACATILHQPSSTSADLRVAGHTLPIEITVRTSLLTALQQWIGDATAAIPSPSNLYRGAGGGLVAFKSAKVGSGRRKLHGFWSKRAAAAAAAGTADQQQQPEVEAEGAGPPLIRPRSKEHSSQPPSELLQWFVVDGSSGVEWSIGVRLDLLLPLVVIPLPQQHPNPSEPLSFKPQPRPPPGVSKRAIVVDLGRLSVCNGVGSDGASSSSSSPQQRLFQNSHIACTLRDIYAEVISIHVTPQERITAGISLVQGTLAAGARLLIGRDGRLRLDSMTIHTHGLELALTSELFEALSSSLHASAAKISGSSAGPELAPAPAAEQPVEAAAEAATSLTKVEEEQEEDGWWLKAGRRRNGMCCASHDLAASRNAAVCEMWEGESMPASVILPLAAAGAPSIQRSSASGRPVPQPRHRGSNAIHVTRHRPRSTD